MASVKSRDCWARDHVQSRVGEWTRQMLVFPNALPVRLYPFLYLFRTSSTDSGDYSEWRVCSVVPMLAGFVGNVCLWGRRQCLP